MDDLISRQMAQRLFGKALTYKERIEKLTWTTSEVKQWLADCMEQLPSAQPDNQVHLCDSCSYTYPECPSVYTDMIFGNGTGNDNICACSKYLPSAQPEQCEDAVSRAEVLRMIDCINDHHAITPYKSAGAVTEHLTRIARSLPPVTPKQPDCAKCKSELANKIRGQQDNPGMLTENDKGRNWGLEWAAQIVEGKRR